MTRAECIARFRALLEAWGYELPRTIRKAPGYLRRHFGTCQHFYARRGDVRGWWVFYPEPFADGSGFSFFAAWYQDGTITSWPGEYIDGEVRWLTRDGFSDT